MDPDRALAPFKASIEARLLPNRWAGNDRPAEKRKVDSPILSLTTTDRHG
jgi:hypothetical protein